MNKVRSKILRVTSPFLDEPKMVIFVQKFETMLGLSSLEAAIIQHDNKTFGAILRRIIVLRYEMILIVHNLRLYFFEI